LDNYQELETNVANINCVSSNSLCNHSDYEKWIHPPFNQFNQFF